MIQFESYEIDLRSDTVTKPTKAMVSAICKAHVGDDVYSEDNTVMNLEQKIAKILGKGAALFVPSGTMANLIAILVHCNRRGAEILVGDKSHIFLHEQGGPSQLGGVMVSTLKNKMDGTFDLDALEEHIRGSDIHEPQTMMIAVENTQNCCGGKVLPLNWLEQFVSKVRRYPVALHMDGARLFNASEYLGVDPAVIVKHFDSVSVCFSKGLGAPVGSALVGSKDFIAAARRVRKVLGGGMRQVGVIAAPCVVALDEIVPLLTADHRRAKAIAKAIYALRLPSFSIDTYNQHTNIILIEIFCKSGITADKVVGRLACVTQTEIETDCKTQNGEGIIVRSCALAPNLLRLVTHHQISDQDIEYAIKKVAYVLKEMEDKNKNI